MSDTWISLEDIPAEGREFSFADQEAWQALFREFRLDAKVGTPLSAEFRVQVQGDGVIVSGRLHGSVVLSCSRCTGEVEHIVDLPFELYEELESEDGEKSQFLKREGGKLLLDAAEMLWEEFSLDLPGRVLCAEGCRGLCPGCGVDLNSGECACSEDRGDPRLAALRGLKIDRKS